MAQPAAIPWTQIKALSFDIFGTLVDWEAGMWKNIKESAIGPYVDNRSEVMALISRNDNLIQEREPTKLQRDVIAEGLRMTAKDYGLVESGKMTAEQLQETSVEYGRKIGTYEPFPDTVAAIQRLSKHYKLFPLTNVDNWSFQGTLANALKEVRFDAIYTAEDIGSYKPDHKNFHYLLNHIKQDFGVDQTQLCHVAQSLYHDHRPAAELNLPYHVWVDRQRTHRGPDYQDYQINLRVETLGELADIVDDAFRRA